MEPHTRRPSRDSGPCKSTQPSTRSRSLSAPGFLRRRPSASCLTASSTSGDENMAAKVAHVAQDPMSIPPMRRDGRGAKRLRSRASLRTLHRFFSPTSTDEPVPPIPAHYLTHKKSKGAFPNPYGCQHLIAGSSALSLWGSVDPRNLPTYRCSSPASPLARQPASFDPLSRALPRTSHRLGLLCWVDMSSASKSMTAVNTAEASSEGGEDDAKPPLGDASSADSKSDLTITQPARQNSAMTIPIPARDDKSIHHRPTSGTGAKVCDASDTEASTAPGSPKAADFETRAQIRAAKEEQPIGEHKPNGPPTSVPPTSGHAIAAAKVLAHRFFVETGSQSVTGAGGPGSTVATPGGSESVPASADMSRESSAGLLVPRMAPASSTAANSTAANLSHMLAPVLATQAKPPASPALGTSPALGSETGSMKSQPMRRPTLGRGDSKSGHPADKPVVAEQRGKSVFGKLFDKKEGKESGGDSDGGSAVGKMIGRKPSGKKSSPSIQSNSDSVNDPEHGAAIARQASNNGRNLVQASGDKVPTGDKTPSKFRDMVAMAPMLGRKTSSSRGGVSDDGKSDDGHSRGGSQATTSLSKKYGVCDKAAIGKGATAVVRLAHKWDRGTDKLYAVKEFRKRRKGESEREYVKKLTSEFCISSTLHHDNVVETVDLVQDENHHWCEVMEYCPGGDLYAAIKRGSMSQAEINSYLRQMLCGVTYLHSMGVAHRDIKPENLLLDAKGHLKITDFGVSDVFRMCWEKTTHLSKGLCGSEPYLPKEMFERKEYDARLVDVWACAIVYYCCCMQELPWRVAKSTDPSFAVFLQSYSHTTTSPLTNLPRESRPLMKKMLHPDPEQRPQMDVVVADVWFKSLEVIEVNIPPLTSRERTQN